MEGTVKTVTSKGFGWIETKEDIEFFFHHTEFKGDWRRLLKKHVCKETIKVTFDNDTNAPEGPRALNVIPKDPELAIGPKASAS